MKIRSESRLLAPAAGAALASILMLGTSAWASNGTATTTFTVTATVVASCVTSATNMGFGNYTAGAGTPDNASSTISVTCTNNDPYTIALNGGDSGHVAARTMLNGANALNYGVYTSSGYTTIWGDGTGGTQTVSGTGSGAAQNYTAYGQVPTAEYVTAGAYLDTLTATVTF
ncbi:MAG TPA: spore coat U domain-containing protein [Rhizomicrobium sp.]